MRSTIHCPVHGTVPNKATRLPDGQWRYYCVRCQAPLTPAPARPDIVHRPRPWER